MNGIERITERIEADLRAEIEEINARALKEVEALRGDYQGKAGQLRSEMTAQAKTDAESLRGRLVRAAELEAAKDLLAARQELIDTAFERAVEGLLGLPEDSYIALLAGLAANAARTGSEEVIFSQKDRARLGKQVVIEANKLLKSQGKNASLTMSEQSRPIRGGLLLHEDRVETNCAFETLARLRRSELAFQVSKLLFD